MEREENEKNYYYIILLLLCVTAFLVRIEVIRALLIIDSNILFPASVTDMATYYKLGLDISRGIYSQPYYYQPFYYAVFLSSIFKFIPGKIFSVLIVQALLGALTVYFSAQTAKKLFSRSAALLTAVFITFSQVLIFYTSYMLLVTLQAFLVTMLMYFSVTGYRKSSNFYWCMIGLTLGCSILTRGNMWILLPGFLILAAVRGYINNRSLIKKILPVMCFLIFLFLPMIPFVYTNSLKTGQITGPSTATGAVLLFGNTPESPPGGNEVQYGPGIVGPTETGEFWSRISSKVPVVASIYNYWKERPLMYAELTFRKMLLFWDMKEIPNNVDINKSYEMCKPLRVLGFIPSFLLIILGGAGLLFFIPRMFWKKTELLIPFYILTAYWISISLFYILGRFRAPILPVLAVYSGCLSAYLFSYYKEKGRNIALALLAILFVALISLNGYDFYRYNLEKKIIKYINQEGSFVELDKSVMFFDNGPMLYGSWQLIPLKAGDTISKSFFIPVLYKEKKISLVIPVVFNGRGDIQFEIEGRKYNVNSSEENKSFFECNVLAPVLKSTEKLDKVSLNIKLKIVDVKGNAYLIYDKQRDFERTYVDGVNLDGELVSKLFIEK